MKTYPYSLRENGNYLEYARTVLRRQNTPESLANARRIDAILAKESFYTPNVAWLTGPELSFAKMIIRRTCGF